MRGITIGAELMDSDASHATLPHEAQADGRVFVPPGTSLVARVLSIGQAAIGLAPTVIDALDELGRNTGLGNLQPVRVAVDPSQGATIEWSLSGAHLPTKLCGGSVPWLRIILESPLSLKRRRRENRAGERPRSEPRDSGRRTFAHHNSDQPTFSDFLGDSVRTVRRAITEYADPDFLREPHLGDFVNGANGVASESAALSFFQQNRVSRRQGSHRKQSGWTGSITFRDVPLAYIPWLIWGGRLGIGDSRNCGAGLWHVVLA